MSSGKPLTITDIRPPNPYDFSSLCEFLEKVFQLDDFVSEYSRIIQVMEQHANEKATDKAQEGADTKQKVTVKVFEDEQFEYALIRAMFMISSSLIKFKQKSPQEQDNKRKFLHQDNEGSVQNVLTAAGFPEMFGRNIVGKRIPDIKSYKISKTILKAHSVFNRAFYFKIKENELTKKSIDELIAGVRSFTDEEDVKQYLETLLYKVELASTEKSFNSMKKKIADPLLGIMNEVVKEFEKLEQGGSSHNPEYFVSVQAKMELLKEYNEEYFNSADFVFVEKNLLQFKKAKAEQQEKNSRPLLSDEFLAAIENKLMIQLISAFKKVYNMDELYVLKCYMVKSIIGDEGAGELTDFQLSKLQAKKKILLDSLKRIRTDMIVEDTFSTATENKKGFIENMEKELFQLSPSQLKSQVLKVAEKKSEDLVSRAKRMMAKKANEKTANLEEARKFQEVIEMINLDAIRAIIDFYMYNSGQLKGVKFQEYAAVIDPKIKMIESTIKKIGKGPVQEEKKSLLKEYFSIYAAAATETTALNTESSRIFQVYLKGLIDRVDYW